MTINNEVNFSIVDRMNALTNAEDIKNTAGQTLDIVGIMTYTTVDKATGEMKSVGAVKIAQGNIYGFTSATLIECAEMMCDAFADGAKSITVETITKQSNNKRTFYQFKIISVNA